MLERVTFSLLHRYVEQFEFNLDLIEQQLSRAIVQKAATVRARVVFLSIQRNRAAGSRTELSRELTDLVFAFAIVRREVRFFETESPW